MDALASPTFRMALLMPLVLLIVLSASSSIFAQEIAETPGKASGVHGQTRIDRPSTAVPAPSETAAPVLTLPGASPFQLPDLTKRENVSAAMQIIILLTVLSLAPAILIMMTCFTRIIIVLSLLRQALGTQQLPPNQILIGLSMFMTFLVMGPTWQRVNDEALRPYLDGQIEQSEARIRALVPVREFMIRQIQNSENDADVDLFSEFAGKPLPATWEEVNTITLVPAFMLSELKTAFLLGFKVYLPFLVIDMVISIVLISMGMMMLPPVLISLPFKLLLFVLVDGWHLITQSLMSSFVM
jgi:flagellar biosynthesis protein FliP